MRGWTFLCAGGSLAALAAAGEGPGPASPAAAVAPRVERAAPAPWSSEPDPPLADAGAPVGAEAQGLRARGQALTPAPAEGPSARR